MLNGKTQLLVIDDDVAHLASLVKIFERMKLDVVGVPRGVEALRMTKDRSFSVILSDLMLPDYDGIALLKEMKVILPEAEVIIMTAYGTIERAVESMREGAYDFITKPFRRAEIEQVVRRALERANLIAENRSLKEQLARVQDMGMTEDGIIGHAPAFRKVFDIAAQAAPSMATILLMGESGTGKEVFAKAIHQRSPRRDQPFIVVNCGALPEGVIEAELFGVERGAFTGAVQTREGRFSRAKGGTLFLDEIGELPLHLQVKLLRVLQSGDYERVGGDRALKTDCRLIAATNIDLNQAIIDGDFREDLFYRINVIAITLPPLRARVDDIPLLAEYFLQKYNARHQREIEHLSPDLMQKFMRYGWPGNVRELENCIERAVVLSRSAMIQETDLPGEMTDLSPATDDMFSVPIGTPLQEVERRLLNRTLAFTQGDKRRAAQLLGIATRTVYRKLAEQTPLEIDPDEQQSIVDE